MKILAVADKESSTLLNWIELAEPHLKLIDLIVSCGDLPKDYLEFISTSLGKQLVYVRGNHDTMHRWGVKKFENSHSLLQGPIFEETLEEFHDLHDRLFYFQDWVIIGFEGSLWYNGEGPQYHEEEMFKILRQVEQRLRVRKVKDWFYRSPKKIIVVSHTPPCDVHDAHDLCHRGFECFHHLIHYFSPMLWIHGHTSTENLTQIQMDQEENTTIINSYEYKFIVLEEGKSPLISYKPSDLG